MSKSKSIVCKVSVDGHVLLPREVGEKLRVGAGDRVRFALDPRRVRIEKDAHGDDEPFAAFREWSSEADDEAFGEL